MRNNESLFPHLYKSCRCIFVFLSTRNLFQNELFMHFYGGLKIMFRFFEPKIFLTKNWNIKRLSYKWWRCFMSRRRWMHDWWVRLSIWTDLWKSWRQLYMYCCLSTWNWKNFRWKELHWYRWMPNWSTFMSTGTFMVKLYFVVRMISYPW